MGNILYFTTASPEFSAVPEHIADAEKILAE